MKKRRHVGCPWPVAAIQLGERFGKWPWELDEQPADRVRHYIAVMGIQGEAKSVLATLDQDEPFFRDA